MDGIRDGLFVAGFELRESDKQFREMKEKELRPIIERLKAEEAERKLQGPQRQAEEAESLRRYD